MLMGTASMVVFALALLGTRDYLGWIFSGDAEVIRLTSFAVPTLAISLIGA